MHTGVSGGSVAPGSVASGSTSADGKTATITLPPQWWRALHGQALPEGRVHSAVTFLNMHNSMSMSICKIEFQFKKNKS